MQSLLEELTSFCKQLIASSIIHVTDILNERLYVHTMHCITIIGLNPVNFSKGSGYWQICVAVELLSESSWLIIKFFVRNCEITTYKVVSTVVVKREVEEKELLKVQYASFTKKGSRMYLKQQNENSEDAGSDSTQR